METILKELDDFFRFQKIIDIYKSGGFDALLSFQGITAVLGFMIIVTLIYEILAAVFIHKKGMKGFTVPLLIKIVNRILSHIIIIATYVFCVKVFGPLALWKIPMTWYGFLAGYVVWEFGHFLYHYWGHKVRLFWCFHGQHHAPEDMNLSVNFAHFFMEGPYSSFIRTTTCMLLGISPEMLVMIMVIDGIWGELIHLSEDTLKNGRLGFLNHIILTPSHHRVHHSRNDLYMDTNFCNLLNIWDRVFGTYQNELETEKPVYGVSRTINPNSLWDVYMGELVLLAKDVYHAPGLLNKLKYLIMPPGWSHTGVHQLASDKRNKALASIK
jgi:sterol desaturase/sphingolipid hydroxylase (fatty acid hydroxylase superfamily)